MLDVQHGLARRARLLVHLEADLAAHHHGGQLLCRRVAGVDGADILALAEHGAPVGDGHDLRELVGDEEDGLALGRKVFHDLHQLVDLLRGEDRGRLVEDEDLVVAVEHLQNFGALLHADGNVLDEGVRVDAQAVFLAQREDLFPGLGLLQKARLVRLDAEDDVVEDGEAFHQLEVLVHHPDAERVGVVRVVDVDDLAVFLDRAFFRLVQAEQDAHQRGFARAVLAEQRVNLAAPQLQGDVVIGLDPGEFLRDVQHLDHIFRSRQTHHSFSRFVGIPAAERILSP